MNLPANAGDTGQEDLLGKEMATHSSILTQKNPTDRGASPRGPKELDTTERAHILFQVSALGF